jgi:hypothetical protein
MCIICIEFDRGRMTVPEARRALGEMSDVTEEHATELREKLDLAEKKEEKP